MPKLSYKVYREDFNAGKIVEYDIFATGFMGQNSLVEKARELKNSNLTRADWEEAFRKELQYHFWCKAEHEIVLTSWPPHINVEDVEGLVQEITEHEKQWGYKQYRITVNPTVAKKVDIYDQLMLNKDIFFDYVWNNI